MAQLVVNIPDAVAAEVVNLLSRRFGYTTDNPDTKTEFVRKRVAGIVKTMVREQKQYEQAEIARSGVNDFDIT